MTRWSTLALLLALGLLTVARAQTVRDAARDVLELAKQSEAGKDVDARAKALKRKYARVNTVMGLYNPRSRGGIGFGPQTKGRSDAIEQKFLNLGKTELSAETLKKESAELVRLAHINLVAAEVTRGFAPAKPFLGRGKKEWEQDVEALKKASRELLKAVKDGDTKAVKTAAGRINNACNSCHGDSRD
jgi:hypothetical protein